jgi:hypothetical protein
MKVAALSMIIVVIIPNQIKFGKMFCKITIFLIIKEYDKVMKLMNAKTMPKYTCHPNCK